MIINRKPTKTERSTEFYKMLECDVYQANIEQDTAIQNIHFFFFFFLRHQAKCLAIKAYLLVIGNFSVLNSCLLFKLDFIKVSILFLTLWVLCCVVSFWFQHYVWHQENFPRLLEKSRKGTL